MDDASLLAWASEFNYQKIIDKDSVTVTIPANILSSTDIATISTRTSNAKQFRLRVQYNGKRTALAHVDLIGTGASLYAYANGPNIIIGCDSSGGSPVTVTIYYRVYLDG